MNIGTFSMDAPQRRLRYQSPVDRPAPGRARRVGARLGRMFVLAIIPVLLMLGSVYMHTLAAGLVGETARLEKERAKAEDEGERLEVQVTDLSEPGRIRSLAKKNLGMRDPGEELTIYGSDGEDVANGGGEQSKGTGG